LIADSFVFFSFFYIFHSAQTKEVVPIRPKTPLVDTRNRPKTPSMGVGMSGGPSSQPSSLPDHLEQHREINRTPVNALAEQFQNGMNFQDNNGVVGGYNSQQQQQRNMMNRSRSPGRELDSHPSMQMHYENGLPPDAGYGGMPNGYPPAYESDYGRMGQPSRNARSDPYAPNPYTGGSYSMDASRPMDYGYQEINLNSFESF
jgi:hypothetical protein